MKPVETEDVDSACLSVLGTSRGTFGRHVLPETISSAEKTCGLSLRMRRIKSWFYCTAAAGLGADTETTSQKVHTSSMLRVTTLSVSYWNNLPFLEPAWLCKCFFINISRSRNMKTVCTIALTSALKGIVYKKVTIDFQSWSWSGRWEFPAYFSAFSGSQRSLPTSLLKRREKKLEWLKTTWFAVFITYIN